MKKSIWGGIFLVCSLVCWSRAIGAEKKEERKTTTPIKHLIVFFQENVSFDHYFATYPGTAPIEDDKGHTLFTPKPGTTKVNMFPVTVASDRPPFLIKAAVTCDMDHSYTDEQKDYMDGFSTKSDSTEDYKCPCGDPPSNESSYYMAYYDGRTVTALWNYAQRFSMSENYFNTTFGPSSLGALNLVSGQTYGVTSPEDTKDIVGANNPMAAVCPKGTVGTLVNDLDPAYDDASVRYDNDPSREGYYQPVAAMAGRNIGELLNGKKITWGWFQGGFDDYETAFHTISCSSQANSSPITVWDYVPHHEPFQYYKSTANPMHLPPSSLANIGRNDQANHQYDLVRFQEALDNGNLPEVCFLKAPAYQNAHAANSGPVYEQQYLVHYINEIQRSKYWKDTAIIITYDDSDGWYDRRPPPQVNGSQSAADYHSSSDPRVLGGHQGRRGYGPRLPFLVLSPWARVNHVDENVLDQTSIIRFIEDNWGLGRISDSSFDNLAGSFEGMFDFTHRPNSEPLVLDENTGAVIPSGK